MPSVIGSMNMRISPVHHCTILKSEIVGKLVTEVSGDGVVPRKGTVVRGRSREDDVWAELEV